MRIIYSLFYMIVDLISANHFRETITSKTVLEVIPAQETNSHAD